MPHILHARSCNHFRCFPHTPRPPRPLTFTFTLLAYFLSPLWLWYTLPCWGHESIWLSRAPLNIKATRRNIWKQETSATRGTNYFNADAKPFVAKTLGRWTNRQRSPGTTCPHMSEHASNQLLCVPLNVFVNLVRATEGFVLA